MKYLLLAVPITFAAVTAQAQDTWVPPPEEPGVCKALREIISLGAKNFHPETDLMVYQCGRLYRADGFCYPYMDCDGFYFVSLQSGLIAEFHLNKGYIENMDEFKRWSAACDLKTKKLCEIKGNQ
ncbi:MAG: hypothetical protein FWF01_02645 [Alphaproteobacteria bacterium]|nr:hypothetical protein [Alphaproteobacteria bacterium]